MKYALALIVAALVWWHLLRKLLAFGRELGRQARHGKLGASSIASQRAQAAQAMLPCQLCGVHVPRNEVFYRAGRAYCCAEHARQAGQGGPGA